MVLVRVGGRALGIGVVGVRVRVVVCGRAGALGSPCARCSGPLWRGGGGLTLSPPGEIRARATQPPGHTDMPPGRPTAARARGRVRPEV